MNEKRDRRSIRLSGYDYTQPGAYFITIVTYQRESLLARIVRAGGLNDNASTVDLTEIGRIAYEEWFKTPALRPYVRLEIAEFVVMPNHVHGIIWITAELMNDLLVGAQRRCAPTGTAPTGTAHPPGVAPQSLAAIVRAYKSAVSYRANALRDLRGTPLWQRNYYEHIIRDPAELDKIREYIHYNPLRWQEDRENPASEQHP